MKIGIFILGAFMGIVMTVLFYNTMPVIWDNYGVYKQIEKQKNRTIIVISHDPEAKHEGYSFGSIGSYDSPPDEDRWREYSIHTFRSREDALEVRREVLSVLEKTTHKQRWKR